MAEEYHKSARESAPNNHNFPKALQSTPRWMGTRFRERKDGKVDKPPYRVCRGAATSPTKAEKTNPENWATYQEALASLERGDVDAVGFVFTEDDPFFVVDLDGVVDPETGEIERGAAEIIHTMASYTELSCSGTGVHIIGVGQKPDYSLLNMLIFWCAGDMERVARLFEGSALYRQKEKHRKYRMRTKTKLPVLGRMGT
jgi:primase-polymerase (primpol)-like protein